MEEKVAEPEFGRWSRSPGGVNRVLSHKLVQNTKNKHWNTKLINKLKL